MPNYLLNAQGNKVWYNRPDNKEHKVGGIWFEKNGLYDRMYVWNGSQWGWIDTGIGKVKGPDKQISDARSSTTSNCTSHFESRRSPKRKPERYQTLASYLIRSNNRS